MLDPRLPCTRSSEGQSRLSWLLLLLLLARWALLLLLLLQGWLRPPQLLQSRLVRSPGESQGRRHHSSCVLAGTSQPCSTKVGQERRGAGCR